MAIVSFSRRTAISTLGILLGGIVLGATVAGAPGAGHADELDMPRRLQAYFEEMSVAEPFLVRDGEEGETHRDERRAFVLESVGLQPLPERLPLDVSSSAPLDHPWCTVRRISYRLWPEIYATGLLYLPKDFPERPAPAVLCPRGHWADGNAHPTVQTRCLNLARRGYVTFSTEQIHFEDLVAGVSHQTVMIWNNMRALDFLETLPEVDAERIGVAGASGGGLQTQMLVALDPRVKAASIVGLTCDFRRIMFPDGSHCDCNHFPGVMRATDHPEISTLGLPCPVQYLTMQDWTQHFAADNFPTIRRLYAAHGHEDRVECRFFATGHDYDREKREHTYAWMDRWLRGTVDATPTPEPATTVFPVATILALTVEQPNHRGFAGLPAIHRATHGVPPPALTTAAEWRDFRAREVERLAQLLGIDAELPRREPAVHGERAEKDGLLVERVGFPSEGPILVPTIVVRPAELRSGALPIEVILGANGKDALLALSGDDSPRARARRGALVVLPDLRTFGEAFSTGTADAGAQARAWQRNGIVWGRPEAGMAVTDLRAVLDGVAARPDADPARVGVSTRASGDLAAAALFAVLLDRRITAADLDFAGACYEDRTLRLVPRILLFGDVVHWAAVAADRDVRLRNLPAAAGDVRWLEVVRALARRETP